MAENKQTESPAQEEAVTETEAVQEVTSEPLPPKDLSRITSINWPSNPRKIVATQYVDVRDLELASGQKGYFVKTPEGFVFERVDIVPLKECPECSIALSGDDGQLLGAFELDGLKVSTVKVTGRNRVTEGEFYGSRALSIENLGGDLDQNSRGRIAITFIGYLIEPWR